MKFFTLIATVSGGAAEISSADFDATIKNGKGTFAKFFAPWCGHCKRMKPDWDKLADEFKDSPNVQIIDVDCTAAGKDACGKHGVRGYPTVKYFLADEPTKAIDYKGGRDGAALKKFVETTFKPPCNAKNKENCSPDQIKIIDSLKGKSEADVKKFIKEKDDKLKQTATDRIKHDSESKKKIKDFEKTEEILAAESATGKKVLEAITGKKHDEL